MADFDPKITQPREVKPVPGPNPDPFPASSDPVRTPRDSGTQSYGDPGGSAGDEMAHGLVSVPAKDPYTDGTPADGRPQMYPGMLFQDQGSLGLRQYGGWVREEFLRALQGREAARVYREMRDNDATIGAMLFAIEQTIREIDWETEPAGDDGESRKWAEFVDSLKDDLRHSWQEFVVEALSMLPFGFAPMEIVWKRRDGEKDPYWGGASVPAPESSKYNDGLIGVADLPLRGQETVLRWFFDNNGQITGMQQQPWIGSLINIPSFKLALFRPRHYKNNPEGISVLRNCYRCYSEDTEILTENGWKLFSDLCPDERVATLNQTTGYLEYQLPIHRYRYWYEGKMFHQKGRFIDHLVTPNHMMYVKRSLELPYERIEAQYLPRNVWYKTIEGEYQENLAIDQREWIDYEGEVFCVEVPNGIIYVRRKGKSSWCGNSYFFIKRIEEEEAILFERMNGLPVLHVPSFLLEQEKSGNPAAMAAMASYRKLVTNTRIDEQMGVIIPSDMWKGDSGPTGHPMYKFELMVPSGSHMVDPEKVLTRYQLNVLKTCMADFIDLGHQARGTQNLAISKVDMFFNAIRGWLAGIADELDRSVIQRTLYLNGVPRKYHPKTVPDLAQRIDLDAISNFVMRLSQAGARMFPDDDLENYLRESAGMPDIAQQEFDVDTPTGYTNTPTGVPMPQHREDFGERGSSTKDTDARSVAKWLADEVLKRRIREFKGRKKWDMRPKMQPSPRTSDGLSTKVITGA